MLPERSVHKGLPTLPGTTPARQGQCAITTRRLVAIVAILSGFPVSAVELVDRADANGDGYVSLYELRAAYYADVEFNRRIEESFASYDTDGDGLISEAERRARAVATAETAPGTGLAATAPGENGLSPGTGSAPAAATTPAPATPVTDATTAPPTPAAESSPAAETVAAGSPATDADADPPDGRSPEPAPATTTGDDALPATRGLSRSELWIQQIDANNSGGASKRELAASGDGHQWLSDSDFESADKNGDGDLDPDELEVLIQGMERRQRR
jgi:hypothetical protein